MKKLLKLAIIALITFSAISGVKAQAKAVQFGWVPNGPTYIGWYPRTATIMRNINDVRTSIVKYGNSQKNWSTSEAEEIQDKWFELLNTSHVNVIVGYTFSSTGDPNFLFDPYLASGTPQ